jgi:hypothetical protein
MDGLALLIISIVLCVLCFTVINLFAISKGQAIKRFKITVPRILEIETEMDKKKEKADVATIDFKKK